jgi:hypothetical protein
MVDNLQAIAQRMQAAWAQAFARKEAWCRDRAVVLKRWVT